MASSVFRASLGLLLFVATYRAALGASSPQHPVSLPLRKQQPAQTHWGATGLHSPYEYMYSVEVEVAGSKFEVLVDTGSFMFAVAASANLNATTFYNGSCQGPNASFKFAGGSFSGPACDGAEVRIGGLTAGRPLFLGMHATASGGSPALRYGHVNFARGGVQGVLGLAYSSMGQYEDKTVFRQYELEFAGCKDCSSSVDCERICKYGTGGALNSALFKSAFDSVVAASDVPNTFSMQCCGTHGDTASGQLVLGGVDETLYSGSLQFTPIVMDGLYFVNVTAVGTTTSNMTLYQLPYTVTTDTGNPVLTKDVVNFFKYQQSCFYVDSGMPYLGLGEGFKAVQDSINEAAASVGLGPVILDLEHLAHTTPSCVTAAHLQAFPDVIIELWGGVTLHVPPSKYLQPQRDYPECLWPLIIDKVQVLGTPVLETYYTVYDQEQKRIGFAPVAGCPASQGQQLREASALIV